MLGEMIRVILGRLSGRKGEESPIERVEKHKPLRWYFYLPRCDRSKRLISGAITLVLIVIFAVSAGNLIGYGREYLSSRRASEELREIYNREKELEQSITAAPTVVPAETPTPTPEPEHTAAPEETAAPTATPVQRLAPLPYPNNPYTIMSSRFSKLRRQNEDIIGWLTIPEMVDEAVVQRDNQYYLTRDYRGYHNNNGAIFLDQSTSLRTRPYTLMLYGHNMKTGLMFGDLRNFENPVYYHNSPFITFDTIYEDGRYVIFAACTISTDTKNWRYVNWSYMNSSSVSLRQQAIDSLFRFSVYGRTIDVRPDDQILLLITCVEKEEDRRIIAARRIREDETEEELLKIVKKTRKK